MEEPIPSGLRPSRGLSSIARLAANKNVPGRKKRHRLYVIAVTDSDSVDFYVGQTTRLVENRLRQHQSRKREKNAARIFQKKLGTADHLRYDLFEGLPYFTEKKAAEQAEGVLADVIETQLKATVECDVLRKRKKTRKAAAKTGQKAVKAQPRAVKREPARG